MDQPLAYLREIISNYTESHGDGQRVYDLLKHHNHSLEDFLGSLSAKDTQFLNTILPEEIKYAKDEKDDKRAEELNNVYEQLI